MKKRSQATQTLRGPTNKQTYRQGRLQYTAQLSAQCNKIQINITEYTASQSIKVHKTHNRKQ